jgi:hypothetical protein
MKPAIYAVVLAILRDLHFSAALSTQQMVPH